MPKTLKTINEEFDKEFFIIPQPLLPQGEAQEKIKSFISSQIKELLEELVGEENNRFRCVACETMKQGVSNNISHTLQCLYRSELQEKIKKILE
jgi:hypothetical protein